MNTITPMDVYWVMQMDSIRGFLEITNIWPCMISALCGIGIMVSTIVDLVGKGFSECEENYKKTAEVRLTFLKTVCISAPIWASLSLASAFTPDTKTLAAAYVVPAIVNSKGVAKVEGASIKLLDLLEKRLTDELSAKAGGYDAKAH